MALDKYKAEYRELQKELAELKKEIRNSRKLTMP